MPLCGKYDPQTHYQNQLFSGRILSNSPPDSGFSHHIYWTADANSTATMLLRHLPFAIMLLTGTSNALYPIAT